MADQKLSAATALTGANTAAGDLFDVLDVSDTTMAATGTNKSITRDELKIALLTLPGAIAGVTVDATTNKPVTAASLAGGTLPASVTTLAASGTSTLASINSTGTLANTGAITATTTGKVGTTLGVGNATPSASGAGITFPATESASTDPNTLDDYEEGTWTPVLADAATAGNIATLAGSGSYTKSGDLVTVRMYVSAINTTGMTAGNAIFIRSFPFAASGSSVGAFYTYRVGRNAATVSSSVVIVSAATVAKLQLFSTNSATTDLNILVSDFVSGTSEIILTLTYKT